MARVAVCNKEPLPNGRFEVLSIIVAEVTDHPQEGTFLVDADNSPCEIGWHYDQVVNDFTKPITETSLLPEGLTEEIIRQRIKHWYKKQPFGPLEQV